jgi:hypothetical protein
MAIQIIGDYVYEVTVDECGESTALVGLLSEMTKQEKEYYNIENPKP